MLGQEPGGPLLAFPRLAQRAFQAVSGLLEGEVRLEERAHAIEQAGQDVRVRGASRLGEQVAQLRVLIEDLAEPAGGPERAAALGSDRPRFAHRALLAVRGPLGARSIPPDRGRPRRFAAPRRTP